MHDSIVRKQFATKREPARSAAGPSLPGRRRWYAALMWRAALLFLALLPIACSESAEPPASASSSSGASDSPDAEASVCGVQGPPRCDASNARCTGTALAEGTGISLTRAAPSAEVQTGVYWRALGLTPATAFTLTADVATTQPDGDGGIQGHGFAVVLVQADAIPPAFPGVRPELPAYLGINVLDGFHGAGAYVKTYNGGVSGVFALRTTQIPSSNPDQVDDWEGPVGNDETFGRTEPTYLRLVLVNRPGSDPSVELLRFSGPDFVDGHSLQTTTLTLPALDRLDYVGVSSSRGDDAYSQSGHQLRALSVTCD